MQILQKYEVSILQFFASVCSVVWRLEILVVTLPSRTVHRLRATLARTVRKLSCNSASHFTTHKNTILGWSSVQQFLKETDSSQLRSSDRIVHAGDIWWQAGKFYGTAWHIDERLEHDHYPTRFRIGSACSPKSIDLFLIYCFIWSREQGKFAVTCRSPQRRHIDTSFLTIFVKRMFRNSVERDADMSSFSALREHIHIQFILYWIVVLLFLSMERAASFPFGP